LHAILHQDTSQLDITAVGDEIDVSIVLAHCSSLRSVDNDDAFARHLVAVEHRRPSIFPALILVVNVVVTVVVRAHAA
jgi:hypothetical protein